MFWFHDPVTKKYSVSLTILIYSGLFTLIANALLMAGKVSTVGSATEIFYSSVALYFGRRLNIGGKSFTADAVEEKLDK